MGSQWLANQRHLRHRRRSLVSLTPLRSRKFCAKKMAGWVQSLTHNVDAGLARVMNVEHYADLVLDKSRRRQARAAAECLVQKQAANQGLIGMPTGLQSLDLATGGIRPGELWTIGALPGKGKTALGVQVLLANGAAGVPCVAFSLEMQTLEIGKRFLAAKSAVPAMQVRNPQTIRNERWTELLE